MENRISNKNFESFRRFAEYKILPLLGDFKLKDRNHIRSQIKFSKDESELKNKIYQLNERFSLEIDPEDLVLLFENKDRATAESKKYKQYSLQQLKVVIRKWLAIKDEQWIDVILACSLDRKIKGEPIWLFIIGVPSSTKTEIVRCFEEGEMFYQLSTLTPNSLISGYIKKDGNKVEDLAAQLNGLVLILKDFTSILAMSKDKRDEIVGQLREFYDGEINKKLGNLDKKISVKAKVGLIACVTPIIDKYYSVMGVLGERFLKLRSDHDEDAMLEKAIENVGKEEQMRNEMQESLMGFITNVEIKEVYFSKEDNKFLKECSKLLARLRTPVIQRLQGDEYVIDIPPMPEKPVRIFKQLQKLAVGLCSIYGLEKCDKEILKTIKRVVLDSAPRDRQMVYCYISRKKTSAESDISKDLRIPRTSLQRILEVLYRLDLIEKMPSGQYQNIWISKENSSLMLDGWADDQESSKRDDTK